MKLSAWRRNSSATMGGEERMVLTTETRTPLRCTASTRRRKSPSPENSTTWSRWDAISSTSMASSMSMLPLIFRRPMELVYSLVGLVTMVKPL